VDLLVIGVLFGATIGAVVLLLLGNRPRM